MFLQEAPRKILSVNINILHYRNCPLFVLEGCPYHSSTYGVERQGNCTGTGEFHDAMSYLKQHNFDVIEEMCLMCVSNTGSTHKTLYSQLYSKYNPQTVTVIFNKWKFHVESELQCPHVPPWCSTDLSVSAGGLQFSAELQMHADRYIYCWVLCKLCIFMSSPIV